MSQLDQEILRNAALENRIKERDLALKEAKMTANFSKKYLTVRSRNGDVYRRDVKGNYTESGYQRIIDGNAIAHDADLVADVYLYTSGTRTDSQFLEEMYGVTLKEAEILHQDDCKETIRALSAWYNRITEVGNSEFIMSKDVQATFNSFISELRKNLKVDLETVAHENPKLAEAWKRLKIFL